MHDKLSLLTYTGPEREPGFANPDELGNFQSHVGRKSAAHSLQCRLENSVVDLLKILDLDSSPEAQARLARRWNVLVGKNGDAVRNITLYGVAMDEIAKSQGGVPLRLAAVLSTNG
jgi:hypothetical protein